MGRNSDAAVYQLTRAHALLTGADPLPQDFVVAMTRDPLFPKARRHRPSPCSTRRRPMDYEVQAAVIDAYRLADGGPVLLARECCARSPPPQGRSSGTSITP